MNKGTLFILSGPSGAGKSSIYKKVIERTGMARSVSVTTRPRRDDEIEGVSYYFRTEEEYHQMIADGAFFETVELFDHSYGTPKAPILENLDKGIDVLCDVDFHGAAAIKKLYPEAVLIFIMTPDFETLAERLRSRGTESESSLAMRLGAAKRELSKYKMYDYIIFNDVLEDSIEQLLNIVTAEKCKIKNNTERINKLLGK